MTKEKMIEIFEQKGWRVAQKENLTTKQAEEVIKLNDAVDFALSALRPVSREQVRRSEWVYDKEDDCFVCRNCENSALNNYRQLSVASNFCPNCGAPMTDEAVQIVRQRLEEVISE